MTTDTDIVFLERLIAQRKAASEELGIVDRIIAREEIRKLEADLDALRNPPVELTLAHEEPEETEPTTTPALRRGGMSFVVSFLQQWRPGSASGCTFCGKPFVSDDVYLRGELYTVEAKRWTWISLHEDCVLQHSTVRQYFTGARHEDFRAWFREQELRR